MLLNAPVLSNGSPDKLTCLPGFALCLHPHEIIARWQIAYKNRGIAPLCGVEEEYACSAPNLNVQLGGFHAVSEANPVFTRVWKQIEGKPFWCVGVGSSALKQPLIRIGEFSRPEPFAVLPVGFHKEVLFIGAETGGQQRRCHGLHVLGDGGRFLSAR